MSAHHPFGEPHTDAAILQRQLERYAEDFAALVADYDSLRAEFDALSRDVAREAGQRSTDAGDALISRMLLRSHNAVLVTDADNRIVQVNPAFTRITGYSEAEALGQDPRMLASGRHDAAFYEEFWHSLAATGEWHGEIWNRRKNGEVFPEWLHVSVARDDSGHTQHHVAIFSDVSTMKRVEDRIQRLAHHDPLTGLPNRALLNDRLQQALASARRNGELVGLMFLDLDKFKQVNDTLGHDVGDGLLVEFARRLTEQVRDADTVARLGGDEFVILVSRLPFQDDLRVIAGKIFDILADPVLVKGHRLPIVSSIGAAVFPDHAIDAAELLHRADLAMYAAKQGGGSRFCLFSEQLASDRREQQGFEQALRGALARQQFHLLYQPQYDATGRRIEAVEALLRWHCPGRGDLAPQNFLPLAEQTGIIIAIGNWVLRSVCTQQVAWCRAGLPPVRVAINIAPRQLADPEFAAGVEAILAETGMDPVCLELEVTEAPLAGDNGPTLDHLRRLRRRGVRIAIDDFGTGFTSLARLADLPIDAIKLDPCFLSEFDSRASGRQVAVAILAMARSMGLQTIAEGVETETQWQVLAEHLCDQLQGYQFAAPLDAEGITGLLFAAGRQETLPS